MANPQQSLQSQNARPRTGVPTGTATQTQTQTPATRPVLVLRAEASETRHIQWADDVVDNEGMGKKSSKVCCIYHKPHSANESSGEESSSSDSSGDSDSEPDNSRARPVGGPKRGRRKQKHPHQHQHDHDAESQPSGEGSSQRKPSPNAYEKMPNYKQAETNVP